MGTTAVATMICWMLLAALGSAAPTKPGVMNAGGVPYGISNPPGSPPHTLGEPQILSLERSQPTDPLPSQLCRCCYSPDLQ